MQSDKDHVLMTRAVMLSTQMDFRLGPGIRQLIVDKYTGETDQHIKIYLEYKMQADRFNHVIRVLRDVKAKR